MKTTPSIIDLDIGHDPDDSCVAAMIALFPDKYNPALMITNDESKRHGRARFLADMIERAGSNIPVAAGLPSSNPKDTTVVEEAGLVKYDRDNFEKNGIDLLADTIRQHERIVYFSLGAMTNLSAVLKREPDLASRITLFQMGPALSTAYRKPDRAQHNVSLDIDSFKDVFSKINSFNAAVFLLSHASWGAFDTVRKYNVVSGKRQEIGVYADDPFYKALNETGNRAHRLFARHIRRWSSSGRLFSIMHDPLTVLSAYHGVVRYGKGCLTMDDEGVFDVTEPTRDFLKGIGEEHTEKIARYLRKPHPREGVTREVIFSLKANYQKARERIVEAVFGSDMDNLAQRWADYNRSMKTNKAEIR